MMPPARETKKILERRNGRCSWTQCKTIKGPTERKGEVLKSIEDWVRDRDMAELCEAEARWARPVARKVREMFERNLAKMLEKDDTKLAAGRMWQASQSNEMKKGSSLRDFEDFVAALDQNGWDKDWGVLGQDVGYVVKTPKKK